MNGNEGTIIIMGAMDEEINEYLKHLVNPIRKEFPGFVFYEGNLFDKKIVVSKSGVGKVFSAMTTQKLIDVYSPNYLIFTGIAGALNQILNVGDILIAEDSIQHEGKDYTNRMDDVIKDIEMSRPHFLVQVLCGYIGSGYCRGYIYKRDIICKLIR